MQINKLIETGMLEEAHLNLLAMRQEFQQEREQCAEDSPMELAKKEKDLNLLYGELRKKISAIVRDSNKELPGSMARIIQEEEKRSEEPGGLQGSWMEAWREAVREGVRVKVESVPLEQNSSWLAVHLGRMGKAIVEDLENVKGVLRWCYPPSFKVFSTYVKSYHEVAGQHLKKLEQQVTELKDLYALLDWIINGYKRSVDLSLVLLFFRNTSFTPVSCSEQPQLEPLSLQWLGVRCFAQAHISWNNKRVKRADLLLRAGDNYASTLSSMQRFACPPTRRDVRLQTSSQLRLFKRHSLGAVTLLSCTSQLSDTVSLYKCRMLLLLLGLY